MKVVCAWCQRFLSGCKNCCTLSHGICPPCAVMELGHLIHPDSFLLFMNVPDDPWVLWRDEGGEG